MKLVYQAMLLAVIVCCHGVAKAAEHQRYALLVGVTQYPALDARFHLDGPKNDVFLMQKVLLERGFPANNIQILASSDKAFAAPTKSAIMNALAALSQRVQTGDFVFLHFAGHGSQQIASSSESEQDGLDETFLPMDIAQWDMTNNVIPGALTDNEISQALLALRKKGAFVWAIFDSCHAGSMTRAVTSNQVKYRNIAPWRLTPDEKSAAIIQQKIAALSSSNAAARGFRPVRKTRVQERDQVKHADIGGYVAFFAAQSTEVTPEMQLPLHHDLQKSYGLFSYTIAELLSRYPHLRYRQMAQMILQRYAAIPAFAPTPLFEGTDLDAPMLGAATRPLIRQWPLQTKQGLLKIDAGQIHQIGTGALFAILASPGDALNAAIGYLQVTQTTLFDSILAPAEQKDAAPIKAEDIPANATARLIDANLDFSLTVALPAAHASHYTSLEQQAVDSIHQLAKIGVNGTNIQWVQAGIGADLQLLIRDEQIWLLLHGGELIQTGQKKSISIGLNNKKPTQIRNDIAIMLQSVAKAKNLLRLANEMPLTNEQVALDLAFYVTPTCAPAQPHCQSTPKQILAGQQAQLLDQDQIKFVIKNQGQKPVDITLLFIDSQYGIYPYYPTDGAVNRLEPGASKVWTDTVNADTLGLEHMLVIAVNAKPHSARSEFTFLAQPSLPRTRNARGLSPLTQWFREAGFAQDKSSRGFKARAKQQSEAKMRLFSWRARPQP